MTAFPPPPSPFQRESRLGEEDKWPDYRAKRLNELSGETEIKDHNITQPTTSTDKLQETTQTEGQFSVRPRCAFTETLSCDSPIAPRSQTCVTSFWSPVPPFLNIKVKHSVGGREALFFFLCLQPSLLLWHLSPRRCESTETKARQGLFFLHLCILLKRKEKREKNNKNWKNWQYRAWFMLLDGWIGWSISLKDNGSELRHKCVIFFGLFFLKELSSDILVAAKWVKHLNATSQTSLDAPLRKWTVQKRARGWKKKKTKWEKKDSMQFLRKTEWRERRRKWKRRAEITAEHVSNVSF